MRLYVGDGTWQYEVSWELFRMPGDNIMQTLKTYSGTLGGAPYDGAFCVDVSSRYEFRMSDSYVGHFFFSVPLSLIHSLTLSHRVRGSPCILPEHLNNVGRRLEW